MNIPRPSAKQISKYEREWNELDNYVLQEKSLRKLFTETYPHNTNMEDVLIKVCALNAFYSTNIYHPFPVAKRIVELNIDEDLNKQDLTLVNKIAVVNLNEKTRENYSFATKYCSHHSPELYPIYDYYVERMLMHFKKVDEFAKFTLKGLKDYPNFYSVLKQFSDHYDLGRFDLKAIDRYLWIAGKENFPRKNPDFDSMLK